MSNSSPELKWPSGSKWRKWDLHVHSPASANFKGDWEQFIIQLGNADCDVIGINDYFSVDGYTEVKRRLNEPVPEKKTENYKAAVEKLKKKHLFPVVECRATIWCGSKHSNSSKSLNFHIIFDPSVNDLELLTFITGLKVHERKIASKCKDKKFLLENAQVNIENVRDELITTGNYKDKFIIWIPYDEHGGLDKIDPQADKELKARLTEIADILGSANKKQIDFFLGKISEEKDGLKDAPKWLGKKKPCIKGSDSHTHKDELGKLKDGNSQPINKYCWIKADPTFKGLRQIINEPEERVFIGAVPPKVEEVVNNKTRYLSKIAIKKTDDAKNNVKVKDDWFACELPLNSGMVAIIGKKGSGKSALADILALAGNTHCEPSHFSFLTKERFCEKNGKIAKNYKAKITWADDKTTETLLDSKPNENEVELVKYIPQSFLEKVCTEIETNKESQFQIELKNIIFSYLPDADKLEQGTLDDLIAHKTETTKEKLTKLRQEIKLLNIDICKLEAETTDEYKTRLASDLKQKKNELTALGNAPKEVEAPSNKTEEQKSAHKQVQDELKTKQSKLSDLEKKILNKNQRRITLASNLDKAQKLLGKIDNFKSAYDLLVTGISSDLVTLGLRKEDIISLTINKTSLTNKLIDLKAEKSAIDKELAETGDTSLLVQKNTLNDEIEDITKKLDAPNQLYQKYKTDLKTWEQRKTSIEGDPTNPEPETINLYKEKIASLNKIVPDKIKALETKRKEASEQIYDAVTSIKTVYVELFQAVQQLTDESDIIKEKFRLAFDASVVERDFDKNFFTYISKKAVGSFYSDGDQLLEKTMVAVDFNQKEQTFTFIETIIDHLKHDKRNKQPVEMNIGSQLRTKTEVKKLYDYLWSLEYLEPEYSLKFDDKSLTSLSPGERGTLLLVFYLLVDKSNKPIIVDQPEENLDNETVYTLLVPVIKQAKRRRQVIMVTHSPNIAVACDAEQIINCKMERQEKKQIIYKSGAIESEQINKYVVNVLEGTRPAFDNRADKYYK